MTDTKYIVMVGCGDSFINDDDRQCMNFFSVDYILTSYNLLDAGQLGEVIMDHNPQLDAWVTFKVEGEGDMGYKAIIGNMTGQEVNLLPGVTLAPGQGYDTESKEVVTASLDNA